MSESHERLNEYASRASSDDIKNIKENLGGMNKGPVKKIWGNIQLLWAMINDPGAAWSSKVIAIAALVYLISPVDAIPDVAPVLGLTDDVGVIMAAVGSLASQLLKYKNKL